MPNSIKALILDVDGVIVGKKAGFNSPFPHKDVTGKLKSLSSKGIKISLCTAKPYFAIEKIINDANLDNLHIADGGAVIINPIKNKIANKHLIEDRVAKELVKIYLENGVYTEIYTPKTYIIQEDQKCEITKGHSTVLQRVPEIVDSLIETISEKEITKIMPVAKDERNKDSVAKLFSSFEDKLTQSWGVHPRILPLQFGIITAPGVSKKLGAKEIVRHTQIPFENTLGVGDSTSDWQFIKLCKYKATVANAKDELKKLINSSDTNSFIGPSVDKNGILDVFSHFQI